MMNNGAIPVKIGDVMAANLTKNDDESSQNDCSAKRKKNRSQRLLKAGFAITCMMRSFAGFGAGVVLEEFLDQHVAADHTDEHAVAHDWHVFELFAIHVLSDFAQVFVCFC